MSKSLRLSEKWFRRGLWLVALVFASFLIGLGSTIVGDLPRVERTLTLDDFIDRPAAEPLRQTIRTSQRTEQEATREREQAELALLAAQQASRTSRETFGNWLATRRATAQPDQDTELIARTKALDALKTKENEAERAVGAQRQIALDARQARQSAQEKLAVLEEAARKALEAENRRVELRVFAYRLALTLPLLVVAGWLFAKKRKSTWWPFVWGFIYFALFAFFVELVPYLPSYGGYVRYAVGAIVTAVAGVYLIRALRRYVARRAEVEQQSESERRRTLGYEEAIRRIGTGVCPGCERAIATGPDGLPANFCVHCGMTLYDKCGACGSRKNAFFQYCPTCGVPAAGSPVPSAAASG